MFLYLYLATLSSVRLLFLLYRQPWPFPQISYHVVLLSEIFRFLCCSSTICLFSPLANASNSTALNLILRLLSLRSLRELSVEKPVSHTHKTLTEIRLPPPCLHLSSFSPTFCVITCEMHTNQTGKLSERTCSCALLVSWTLGLLPREIQIFIFPRVGLISHSFSTLPLSAESNLNGNSRIGNRVACLRCLCLRQLASSVHAGF